MFHIDGLYAQISQSLNIFAFEDKYCCILRKYTAAINTYLVYLLDPHNIHPTRGLLVMFIYQML